MTTKFYLLVSAFLSLPLWACFPKTLYALESPAPHCYSFTMANSPAAALHPGPYKQRWCYQSLSNPSGATYLYNADNPEVLPELAAVRTQEGTLTHGSLLAGKVTFHSLRLSGFNPLPVPLEEPRNQVAATAPESSLGSSARAVLNELLRHRSDGISLRLESSHASSATATQPWRGYWWPNKGLTMAGPLAKFDHFVSARTGTSPDSVGWESAFHNSHGIWWEGHCNGWAASSILRAQPTQSFNDEQSGETFSVSDQKGVLAEADYCATATMFGHRYDGKIGDDITDVHADLFHKTVLYYIGELHKPLIMDYHRDEVVDNHVISGYKMDVQDLGSGNFSVTMVLRMHQYDGRRIDQPGIAPTYSRTYKYTIRQDSSGTVTSASWISENPDFLWVPLGPGRCPAGNPRVENKWVVRLLSGG